MEVLSAGGFSSALDREGSHAWVFHNQTFSTEEVRVSLAIVRPCRVLILSPDGGPGAGGGDNRIHTVKGLVSPGSE